MNEKKITSHQLFTFTAVASLGGTVLVISSTITATAKQDAWISALITMAFGLVVMLMYVFLGTRYGGLTLVGICQKILGKWFGKAVAAGYVIFFFSTAFGVPWWIGNFGAHIMHETPIPFIILPFIVALVVAIYYDIEAIARFSELAFVFVTVMFLLSVILVLPNAKLDNIQPVYENGLVPILKGAYLLSPYIVFVDVALLMIFPVHISDLKGGKNALYKGFIWCSSFVFITILISILVLGGSIVARSAFPTILVAREINIATVLTRVEYAISSMWIVSEFMIGIFYFYAGIKALSELLGLRDHKKLAAPLGLLCFVITLIMYPNSAEQANWANKGFLPHATLFGFVFPVVMIAVYVIKKKLLRKS